MVKINSSSGSQSVATAVRALLEDKISELGYYLWDVEYTREGATWYLIITIDSDNGIDINDCEKVHRAIDPMLDDADPIRDPYNLEVTSPGIERVLRTREHFDRYIGSRVQIKLFKPIASSKTLIGILESAGTVDSVRVVSESGTLELKLSEIAKANLVYDFKNDRD